MYKQLITGRLSHPSWEEATYPMVYGRPIDKPLIGTEDRLGSFRAFPKEIAEKRGPKESPDRPERFAGNRVAEPKGSRRRFATCSSFVASLVEPMGVMDPQAYTFGQTVNKELAS